MEGSLGDLFQLIRQEFHLEQYRDTFSATGKQLVNNYAHVHLTSLTPAGGHCSYPQERAFLVARFGPRLSRETFYSDIHGEET